MDPMEAISFICFFCVCKTTLFMLEVDGSLDVTCPYLLIVPSHSEVSLGLEPLPLTLAWVSALIVLSLMLILPCGGLFQSKKRIENQLKKVDCLLIIKLNWLFRWSGEGRSRNTGMR